MHYHLAHGGGTWDVNCKDSTALSAHCLSGLVAEEFDFHPKSPISQITSSVPRKNAPRLEKMLKISTW